MRKLEAPTFELKLLSSLAKVFADEEPKYQTECLVMTSLKNETISFQAAIKNVGFMKQNLTLKVISPIENMIHARSVEYVPVGRSDCGILDDNYLKTGSGMYPDLLRELKDNTVVAYPNKWRSVWFDVIVSEDAAAGTYPIELQFINSENEVVCSASTKVTIIDAVLPEQDLIHTEWFHADCLADYYHVDAFSEEHWQIIENFLAEYVSRGCNMLLTPMFTPPLDIAVGGERTTVQLVQITVENGEYHFNFDRLKRWVDLGQKYGIKYFEMSHLFSQWGANYAPRIVATVDGKEENIFGWHTPAVGEYTNFLHVYLLALKEKLVEWGIADITYFHISDEPGAHFETFKAAKDSLGDLLEGYHTFDALSTYDFYENGLVDRPIPGNNEIEPFIEHNVPHLWTYYCVGQFYEVSNRFMSMPSARNRIYGAQLFKFDIEGILHWGYNFYNTQFSKEHINPYEITDAGYAFPSGDSFLVYPGADRHPEESIRMMVHDEALNDVRAFKLLASLTSKEHVVELMEEDLADPLTFKVYPKSDMYLISLRNKVNREIAKYSK